MKPLLLFCLTSLLLSACGVQKKKYDSKIVLDPTTKNIPKESISSKPKVIQKKELILYNETEAIESKPLDLKVKNIIDVAQSFHGTPYKFGGTTTKGIDCSGLVYNSFKEEAIFLPRSSHEMAKKGSKVSLNDIEKGDLLFFKTNRRSNSINHVGIVVDVYPGKILFIHSSTSQGVIISALDESYWNNAFVEARRIIEI